MFGFAAHRSVAVVALLLVSIPSPSFLAPSWGAVNADGSVSRPAAEKKPVHPVPSVTWEKDLLSVSAKQADIREVLAIIGDRTKVPISVDRSVTGTVTDEFRDLPLKDGLDRLLFKAGQRNIVVKFLRLRGPDKDVLFIEEISVLKKASPSGVSDEERSAALAARERAFHEYFAAMDKGKGKIARALKKYQDPTLDKKERLKLRTYLRQTPVDDPEDKQLLKGALLDDRLSGEIVSDIQMALMHAIQSHPEESDKDLILELLKTDADKLGWLIYGMLYAWDQRYVPYLMNEIRREPHSFSMMEMLGRKNVKEAVPLLEEMLKHPDYSVRSQAYITLYQLTGHRYGRGPDEVVFPDNKGTGK